MSEYIKRTPKKARKNAQPATLSRRGTASQAGANAEFHHPTRPARPKRPRRLSAKQQDKLIAEAVTYIESAVSTNVVQAAADQAAGYAGDHIWQALRAKWSGSNCKAMARFARELLEGNDWLHNRFGDLIAWILKALGAHRIVYLFGRQIAKQFVPFPWDHQVKIVARGMQVAGIAICMLDGRDLAKCECFIDVVITEGKERVKRLLLRAAKDWTGFEQLQAAS